MPIDVGATDIRDHSTAHRVKPGHRTVILRVSVHGVTQTYRNVEKAMKTAKFDTRDKRSDRLAGSKGAAHGEGGLTRTPYHGALFHGTTSQWAGRPCCLRPETQNVPP